MFSNQEDGIKLNDGANSDEVYPTISTAEYYSWTGNTIISGTADALVSVEVFTVETTPESSGYGEGKTYLDTVISNASGAWSSTINGLLSGKVTATATKRSGNAGNTSQFSLNMDVTNATTTTTTTTTIATTTSTSTSTTLPTETTTTTSTTTTTIPLSITVERSGATVSSGDVIPTKPDFVININAGTSPVAKLTVSLGGDVLHSYTGELSEAKITVTPTATLSPGTYTLLIEGENKAGNKFSKSLTGLAVMAEKTIVPPTIQVTPVLTTPPSPNQPVQRAPAQIRMEFQSSASGTVDLIIKNASGTTVFEKRFNLTEGKNIVAEELISGTGVKLSRGPYRYILKYGDKIQSGSFFVR